MSNGQVMSAGIKLASDLMGAVIQYLSDKKLEDFTQVVADLVKLGEALDPAATAAIEEAKGIIAAVVNPPAAS